jgi:two-component system, chemotaxis family, chemotaxis protein CheY
MGKALVVDDSRAMRMILSKTLKEAGFEVSQAENGRDALDQLKKDGAAPELILVDWNMPELSGIDFLRALRSKPAYDRARVLMVTTETEIEQMACALEAGANEYLMKPFTPESVLDKLRLLGVAE